jgi:MFS family permease
VTPGDGTERDVQTQSTYSPEEIEDAVLEGDRPISTGTARAALRHRTFRIVYLGAFASNIGTWMQNVVLGAYAYDLTHSSTFVGVMIFAQLGPILLLAMLGGLIADRVDRKKFLMVLSVEQLVFSFALAWVVRAHSPSLVLITLMVVLVGAGGAMFGPAYSAVLPVLVGKEDMPGAISLNSAQMNLSRVIGPPIGAVAYHFVGPSWVFAGNAVTYLFVVIALLMVTLPAIEPLVAGATQGAQGTLATQATQATQLVTRRSNFRELVAGVGVAREDKVVGRCLVTVFVFSLLALAFLGQMPVVAAHNLGIEPNSANYGILYGSFGTGAFLGAISIGTVFARTSKPLIVRVCLLAYAVTLTVFAELRVALAAYFVVAILGAFYFAFITALNTTMQTRLQDALRGRVMALWIMGFGGTVALGNLMIGPVVSTIGITDVLLFGAGIALLLAWYADVRAPEAIGQVAVGGAELAQ